MNNVLPPPESAERALLDSEIRLQQVVDNTSALIFRQDCQGVTSSANCEFERVTVRKSCDVLGRTDDQRVPPELEQSFLVTTTCAPEERHAIEFEETADFGDGVQTFLCSSTFRCSIPRGATTQSAVDGNDITERKRLEEASSSAALACVGIRGGNARPGADRHLSTILGVDGAFHPTLTPGDPNMLHMLAFHLDGRVLENFAYPQSGTPCETVLADGFRFHAARRPVPAGRRLQEVLGTRELCGASAVLLAGLLGWPDRRDFATDHSSTGVRGIGAGGSSRCVSMRSSRRDAAAHSTAPASEANYWQIFETSEDAIYVHDWDTGALVDANPRACEQRGYSREELLRVPVSDLVANDPPYTADEALRRIAQAKRDGSLSFEWHCRNRDGSLRWDEVRLKPAMIGGATTSWPSRATSPSARQAEDALSASEEQDPHVFSTRRSMR